MKVKGRSLLFVTSHFLLVKVKASGKQVSKHIFISWFQIMDVLQHSSNPIML